MSGRGLKARATRAALSRAAVDVRRRGLKARATQVCGGCQVAGYRPALPSSAADVRSRAKSPRHPGLRRMSGRGLKARATRAALPGAAVDVRRRGLKARATWGRGGCPVAG